MENNKAYTFIGFAMRTMKYKVGMNACQTLKKANLVIVCKSASENTVKDAVKLAKKLHCKIIQTKVDLLEEIIHRANTKVMALADKDLAIAVINNSENYFINL